MKVKLTEEQLRNIIGDSINAVLNEGFKDVFGLNKCKHAKQYRYEEEYSKEGEPYYHHTYRIAYCPFCGKVFGKEKMQ